MLRRSIAVFSILAILVSVCIPVFAAPSSVNIWEYADIQVDGLTKEVTISFPDEWLQVGVYTNSWKLIATRDGNVSGFDLSEAEFPFEYMNVVFAPFGSVHNPSALDTYNGRYPNFGDLPNGSVLHYSVSVQLQNAAGESLNVAQSRFNRSDLVQSGNTIQLRNPVNEQVSFTSDVASGIYSSSYDFVLADNTKPFVFQHYFFMSSSNASSRWIFRLDEFKISTSIDALQDLVDATGETNRLLDEVNKKLDEITDRPPDPVEPTWGESAGDAEEKEDQIIDQLDPDKVTNDLADMHLTLVDNLLLYTNAFAAISAIWVVLIDLPFIKIILYCSLLFGLLAAFLGMGLAAGRASDRHSGRSSGKKGK